MESDANETVGSLRQRLSEGETLEVAGYALSSELWREIEGLELATRLTSCIGSLTVFEVGRSGDEKLSVPTRQLLGTASEKGIQASVERISGEPFWATTEIVVNRTLVDRTAHHLRLI
jgi:hypothetical protein